jgi:general secretion pathway protein I
MVARSLPRGFTLIEVMVALAIVSIALLAALRVAGQGSNDARELRTRVLAGWVASNLLAEHAARGDWLPVGGMSGNERQADQEFSWREEVSPTPNPSFRRIDVSVFSPPGSGHVAARLSGLLVRPAGAGR